LTESLDCVSVRAHHAPGGLAHAIAVLSLGHKLTDGSPSSILHRNPFGLGALTQRSLLVVG